MKDFALSRRTLLATGAGSMVVGLTSAKAEPIAPAAPEPASVVASSDDDGDFRLPGPVAFEIWPM